MQSGILPILTETNKENEHVLTVESTGSLIPEQIILTGVDELSNRLSEFKDILGQLKAE